MHSGATGARGGAPEAAAGAAAGEAGFFAGGWACDASPAALLLATMRVRGGLPGPVYFFGWSCLVFLWSSLAENAEDDDDDDDDDDDCCW